MDKAGLETTTEFLWQGDNLIAEMTNSEQYQSYVYEPGTFRPLALLKGEGKDAEVYHYHLDQIGTPLDITTPQGNTVWSVQYRAYGNVFKKIVAEINSPLRFQGQYFDAQTGLHYNRHRYYNPSAGRFISIDPIGLAGGLNNYQYVPNPTGWVDPLGLASVDGDCICGGAYTGNTANFKKPEHIPMTQEKFDEIINQERFNRDAPAKYLPDEYVKAHIEQFNTVGAAFIQPAQGLSNPDFKTLPPRKFAGLQTDMDKVIEDFKKSGNDVSILNDRLALGLDEKGLKRLSNDRILYVKLHSKDKRFEFDIPDGNEFGAFPKEWVPGGETKGGAKEIAVKGTDKISHDNDINVLKSSV